MCGIFGIIANRRINKKNLNALVLHSQQRGKDSSGMMIHKKSEYWVHRADHHIQRLLKSIEPLETNFVMGHSRLITNGQSDNQPVVRDGLVLVHNGIIVNELQVWSNINQERKFEIDSEAILGVILQHLNANGLLEEAAEKVFSQCKGVISAAVALPHIGKLLLLSNNGSLYVGKIDNETYFASEKFPLNEIGCESITQILNDFIIFDIPLSSSIQINDIKERNRDLIPKLSSIAAEESLLVYRNHNLMRCRKCLLPETMPYIVFNSSGICNYCENYVARNNPKPRDELMKLVEPYRRKNSADCIIPFSGGRDSCWGLHLVVNELKMKPITYTYDWGMVTDLGRRNISRMCSELGVENIIIADDISKKRSNIAVNLKAWLKLPHLGMVSILTAGDKHFFRHVETVKKQTGISLNLWGVNPLEVTHFKAGFLGVPPDFHQKQVYMNGVAKQIQYQMLRLAAMFSNPLYFNASLWDTLSGEYHRSFTSKSDYYHIFDYWRWDEKDCEETLRLYNWETASDTNTTWRIGDGTAAFYNYIYYTIAGFTEHDTFRSNQIREGQITRDEALKLVEEENRPRYQNIRWYLDAIGMDYVDTIKRVNQIPSLVGYTLS